MGRILYCLACNAQQAFERNWLDETDVCAQCGAKTWSTEPGPAVAYALTRDDRSFLKSLRIRTT